MSHTALARKYRPRRFAEVATQEHVSETLRRAVQGGRTGHAYIFCGPRGVGKTTLARVLAMALNCPARDDTGEPCGECESCALIWSGRTSLDVVEIDAASHRGVEDARNLRERAMYAPSNEHRFKVYIVDEAHMLTREAWNALLKILEEPPPRVMFIFATTEPQRIQQSASPILSRCQRFDFRRVGVADIVSRLEHVIEREGAQASAEALRIIARKADGGMRDALSLLDQVLSLTGGEVGSRSVRKVLGLVEEERYLELFDIILGHRHRDIFSFVESLVDEGYDLVEFYHGLVETLRLLLRIRLDGEGAVDAGTDYRAALEARAQDFMPADLVRMLAMAADLEAQGSLKRVSQPRVLVELLLLRLSYLDRTVRIEELLESLGGAPKPPVTAPEAADAQLPARPRRTPATRTRPAQRKPAPAQRDAGTVRSTSATRPGDDRRAIPSEEAVPELRASPTGKIGRSPTGTDAAPRRGGPAGAERSSPGPVPPAAESTAPPANAGTDPVAAFKNLRRQGRGILPGGLPFLLRGARVEEAGERRLRVTLPHGISLDDLPRSSVSSLKEALASPLGYRPHIDIVEGRETGPSSPRTVTQEQARRERLHAMVKREPLLARAVEEFDLELLD